MQIAKRTMNWLPRASADDQAMAARDKRRENNDALLAQTSATADHVTLAIQVAVERVQNRTTKKV